MISRPVRLERGEDVLKNGVTCVNKKVNEGEGALVSA